MSRLVDADGCTIAAGVTTWMPWRWGNAIVFRTRIKDRTCALGRGAARMRDPEDGQLLQRHHEIPFEVD